MSAIQAKVRKIVLSLGEASARSTNRAIKFMIEVRSNIMEDLLEQICKECNSLKYFSIKEDCIKTKGILESQDSLKQYSPYELRKCCLKPLQELLESRLSKMASMALIGIQKLLRDNQFYSKHPEEDELQWLSSQILSALQSFPSQPEDIQVEILKVILSMTCMPTVSMSGQIVVQIVDMCGMSYGKGSQTLKSASLSSAIQAIETLFNQLVAKNGVKENEVLRDSTQMSSKDQVVEGAAFNPPVFDELVPIISYISGRLDQVNKEQKKEVAVPAHFVLHCMKSLSEKMQENSLHSTTSKVEGDSQKLPSYCSTLLVSTLWQQLCPSLIAFLGAPEHDKLSRGISYQSKIGRSAKTQGSFCFSNQEAKLIYRIACNLVVAMAGVGAMRPSLEALFHKMLLYPPSYYRYDALKSVAELLRNPLKLVQLAGPILISDPRNNLQCDMSLLRFMIHYKELQGIEGTSKTLWSTRGGSCEICERIYSIVDRIVQKISPHPPLPLAISSRTMDSLVECSDNLDSHFVLIDCISGLLSSLEALCDGKSLPLPSITAVNNAFPVLEDVDYSGPLTYESQYFPDIRLESQSSSSGTDFGLQCTFTESDCTDRCSESKEGTCTTGEPTTFIETDSLQTREALSISSFDTEDQSDATYCQTDEAERDLHQEMRLNILSENLISNSNLTGTSEGKEEENERALHFCSTLAALLPSLLAIRSTIEVDEAVLEFSSKYCQGVYRDASEGEACSVIVNADGIYLTTYAALSLDLKLIQAGYYCHGKREAVPMTKDEFSDSVFGSGVLVYLSFSWVSSVYSQVLEDSFLQRAGYNPNSSNHCALVNLLTGRSHVGTAYLDLNSFDNANQGSQMLSDYVRLEKAAFHEARSASREAGLRLCRRVLTCCWESCLSILANMLTRFEDNSHAFAPIRFLLGETFSKEELRSSQNALILCLNSLQAMTRLANNLGLQKRCGMVFSLLATACLPENDSCSVFASKGHPSVFQKKPSKLHTAHVLSFYVMISSGLELGSHAPDCWNHIFRCCLYISELERKFFSNSGAEDLCFPSITVAQSESKNKPEIRMSLPSEEYDFDDGLSLPFTTVPEDTTFSIEDLMEDYLKGGGQSGFLSSSLSAKAICGLIAFIDKFFDEAANQLNLSALILFLQELCSTSHWQLFRRNRVIGTPRKTALGWVKAKTFPSSTPVSADACFIEESLLLHKIADVVLKVLKSGRPLVHTMRVWAVVGPHFLEAACHKDNVVSKRSVCCIHDIVNSMLNSQVELPFFHFNEALFKPFENLLLLELCDLEVQDQIVNSLCEFVEGSSSDIKSGWRPLFAALRCVKSVPIDTRTTTSGTSLDSVGHTRAVRDVFDAFLSIDNAAVFANAALDCIVCLLKHIRGPGVLETETETVVGWNELVGDDLCVDALRFVYRCALVLSSMHTMPACPVFHSAKRINETKSRYVVDWNIRGVDESYYWNLIGNVLGPEYEQVDYSVLWSDNDGRNLNLREMDNGSGLLQVWYTLLEGLAGAVIICPRKYQPQALDTLFSLMKSLMVCPGRLFGMYCANRFLIPLMQVWLWRSQDAQGSFSWNGAQSFKQYVGLTSDLVVEYLKGFKDTAEAKDFDYSSRLMLRQILHVLVECVSHSSEGISRLGCSCIRHIALSCKDFLSSDMWDILVCSIHRASQVCLFPLYELMALFCPDSPNFYGDLGQVKVAARRDCTRKDTERLRQISQQVFQLEFQKGKSNSDETNLDSEDRSFIFLLFPSGEETAASNQDSSANASLGPPEEESEPRRVPFRALVVGLLANQMILQTLGHMLLEESTHIVPSLANVLFQASDFGSSSHSTDKGEEKTMGFQSSLPEFLKWLSSSQLKVLLNSLQLTYLASVQFDRRPGLKFLIQKVAQTEKAANLYKQAGASWTLEMLTLFDLILSRINKGSQLEVKNILDLVIKKRASDSSLNTLTESADAQSNSKVRVDGEVEDDFLSYGRMLYRKFSELCAAYLDLVSRRRNKEQEDELVNNQPIFFLTIPIDEFSTVHKKNLEAWEKDLEQFNENFTKLHLKDREDAYESDSNDPSCLPRRISLRNSCFKQQADNESHFSHSICSSREKDSPLPRYKDDSDSSRNSPVQPFSFADFAKSVSSSDEECSEVLSCSFEFDSGLAAESGKEQSVYSIATEKDISEMMHNYRRKKGRLSLPPNQEGCTKVNPFSLNEQRQRNYRPAESVPPEIEEQRTSSIMKDSEAHIKVWTEMVVNVFDLVSQLEDEELKPLLPLLFPTVRALTAHAHDTNLRQVLAELLDRVGFLYGFSLGDCSEEPV